MYHNWDIFTEIFEQRRDDGPFLEIFTQNNFKAAFTHFIDANAIEPQIEQVVYINKINLNESQILLF